MSPNRIIVARFSPTGRTRRLMSMIAQGLAGTALPVEELDLTDRWEREEARTFGKGDLVFLGVPVYFGRVPLPMQSLAQWAGNGAAAVPVAAYGCRAHEDTLRELAAVLRAAGFVVPAGAAFPVEHSQFPEFGAGRPNEADRFSAGDFARRVFEALRDGTARFAPVFPGEGELRPYPKTGFVPMPDPVCRMCGRCAEVCPMDIIDPFSMRVKDPSQCIGCRACIDACPDSHRNFPEPVRAAMAQVRERIRPACEEVPRILLLTTHFPPMTTRHLTITDIASTGAGIAYEDGLRVFVPGALPGDEVTAEVDPPARGTRSSVAQYVKITRKSPWWAASPCPAHVARPACGGCALGSLTPEGQAVVKRGLLERALAESGVEAPEPLPLVEAPHDAEAFTQGFRNKAVLYPGVDPEGRWYFAMYAQGSHFPVPESCFCPQTPEWMAKAAETAARMLSLSDLSPWNESHREGDVRTIGVDSEKPQRLFTLCVHGETPEVRTFVGKLAKKLMEEGVTSVFLNLHPTPGNAVLGRHSLHVAGTDGIETTIGGLRFAVRPETFLQVNPGQTERLYAMALEWVAPEKDEVLLDLYCGVGTMTLLAARTCAKAVGVDIVAASIERAKLNAKRNGIENAGFHAGAVEDELPRLIASGIRPAAAILDPAFKGLEETVPAMLTALPLTRFVYVSCNPKTFARDAAKFIELGWRIEKLAPVDLFPGALHVETVAKFVRDAQPL